jgi:hypothetical protein
MMHRSAAMTQAMEEDMPEARGCGQPLASGDRAPSRVVSSRGPRTPGLGGICPVVRADRVHAKQQSAAASVFASGRN